jgi:hypothetical protein
MFQIRFRLRESAFRAECWEVPGNIRGDTQRDLSASNSTLSPWSAVQLLPTWTLAARRGVGHWQDVVVLDTGKTSWCWIKVNVSSTLWRRTEGLKGKPRRWVVSLTLWPPLPPGREARCPMQEMLLSQPEGKAVEALVGNRTLSFEMHWFIMDKSKASVQSSTPNRHIEELEVKVPSILILGSRWRWMVRFISSRYYLRRKGLSAQSMGPKGNQT